MAHLLSQQVLAAGPFTPAAPVTPAPPAGVAAYRSAQALLPRTPEAAGHDLFGPYPTAAGRGFDLRV